MTKNPKREYEEWKAKRDAGIARIVGLFGKTSAIRGTSSGQPRMAIQSAELFDHDAGHLRVTFFGPDGPHGHITKASPDQIAEEVYRSMEPPFEPMTDEEVIAWTLTVEFEKGSKVGAYVQAENTLRWFASKADRSDWARDIIKRANELGTRGGTVNERNKPYDGAAFDDALTMMYAAIRELPAPNPSGNNLVPNPPWVTKALAGSYEVLEQKVPPRWMPQLAQVSSKRNTISAKLVEFGCGAYGCVLPTLEPSTVLKVTSDTTEAEFAATLAQDLPAPIVVEYRMVVALSAKHQGSQIHLLWREAAEHVGDAEKVLGEEAGRLIGRQHAAAVAAYAAVYAGRLRSVTSRKIAAWLETCEQMARGRVTELRQLGRGMIQCYEERGILFGDVHAGNVGMVRRDGGTDWVITDPGNVAVIGASDG